MNDALQIFERLVGRADCRFNMEISPLLDASWTGIPVVAANLARELLRAGADRIAFFFEGRHVAPAAVEDVLRRGAGAGLKSAIDDGRAIIGPVAAMAGPGYPVGFYPSVKRDGGLFPFEIGLIHDLSTLVVPQFHAVANVEYHMEHLVADLETTDLAVCVSQATHDDIEAYLGYPASRLVVAHNGVAWPEGFAAAAEHARPHAEPYLYVLGTLEPRKNLALIARTLAAHPEILDRYKVVISGTPAWDDPEWVLPEATKAMAQAGRLVLTGFVPELTKYTLLRHARATIYPSFFEGFGLPVLESLSVGTPCLASVSSSIPEIGGDMCRYFDPFSVDDLQAAIAELDPRPASPAVRARLIAVAETFTWEAMLTRILAAAEPLILRKAGLV